MVNVLSFMKLLTGANEKTILNARAEIGHKLGSTSISNNSEKQFVIITIINEFEAVLKNIEDTSNLNPYDIVFMIIDRKIRNNEKDFLVIFNRVMVHFYGMKLGDANSTNESLVKLTKEIIYIISNDFF